MGCLKLTYRSETEILEPRGREEAPTLKVVHNKLNPSSKSCDENYRYGYQGEYSEDETDETGFNSFQLRLYDPVIGRWISVDPYRQHASPYMAMGNNPVMYTDADGGCDNSNGPCDGTFSDGTHYHIDADGIFNTFNDDGSIGEFFNVPVIGIEKPSGISKVGSEISFYAGETWNWIKSLENINGRGVINWGSWGGDMSPIGGQSKRGYDNGSGLPGGLGTAGGNSKVDAVNKVTDAVKKALELADAIKGDEDGENNPDIIPTVNSNQNSTKPALSPNDTVIIIKYINNGIVKHVDTVTTTKSLGRQYINPRVYE